MADLVFTGVARAQGGRRVLHDVNLAVRAGEVVALLGANGAGKTTLARLGAGLLAPDAGQVRLDGADPRRLAPAARARALAYLPQQRPLAWPLRVRDVVALGRFAHGARLGALGHADAAAVARALESCELEALADRPADTLSGGELARVHVARALAAEARVLIADEPIAALDPLHAWQVMRLIADFAAAGGAALIVVHDVAMAARFAARIAVLADGRLIADAPPAAAATPAVLAAAYGVRATIAPAGDGLSVTVEGPAAP